MAVAASDQEVVDGAAGPPAVDAGAAANAQDDAGSLADDAAAAVASVDSDLGVVTVTAQRRVNTVQKTPIAITAFNQDAIQQQKISTFRDLSGRVPGLLAPLTSTSLTTQTYSMRGIGEIDTYPEPSVAVYVDDVYLARTVGSLYDTPDLERVEVLRGPQGTLYGRNSAAGAIRFITKDPTAERTASLSVSLGNFENVDVRARAQGALLPDDALNASVSVVRHQNQGYTYDVPLAQWVNRLDLWVARAKLKSQVTERFHHHRECRRDVGPVDGHVLHTGQPAQRGSVWKSDRPVVELVGHGPAQPDHGVRRLGHAEVRIDGRPNAEVRQRATRDARTDLTTTTMARRTSRATATPASTRATRPRSSASTETSIA